MKKKEPGKRGLPAGVRKAGKAAAITVFVLALLVIALNSALAIQKHKKPDEIPHIFGISPLFVMSGSMAPAIKLDDLIFFRPVNTDDLGVGDIIIYAPPENSRYVVTHRIVQILYDESNKRVFLTKGDNNNDVDESPVDADQVLGIYAMRIPWVGKLVEWLIIRPNGVAIFAALPLGLFLVIDLLRRLFAKRYQPSESEAKEELDRLRALVASQTQEAEAPGGEDEN